MGPFGLNRRFDQNEVIRLNRMHGHWCLSLIVVKIGIEARQTAEPGIQVDFARSADHVRESIERDFHDVIVGIVASPIR
jgi:hypothetical protein